MLRAYKVTMYVAIDPEDEFIEGPVTDEMVKDFLDTTLRLDVDLEDNENTVGFRSAEIIIDTLTPMTEAEVVEVYGPKQPNEVADAAQK